MVKSREQMEVLKYKKLQWINIVDVEDEHLEFLRKKFKFHELDLEDCMSEIQRPKIDEYDKYLFLVLHFPYFDNRRKEIRMIEVDAFVGPNFFITIHDDYKALQKTFARCQEKLKLKKEYMSKGSGYLLYMVLDDLFQSCFPILDKMSLKINGLERDVFDLVAQKDMLKGILRLKKDIINFRRIIIPQRSLIVQLEHRIKKFKIEDLEVYFDDIVDKVEKIWGTLENYKELINSLQDTHESLISYRTNHVIRILTVFSVIMLPLTFITGFYGMNIDGLPLAHTAHSTESVTLLMLSVTMLMLIYFKIKKWL